MRKMFAFMIFCVVIFTKDKVIGGGCAPRKYNSDSIVCVCNATYCDTWESAEAPESGSYAIWTTSSDGLRAEQTFGNFEWQTENEGSDDPEVACFIDPSKTYQEVKGFGGAFTDSAGINIMSLTNGIRDKLMRAYFSDDGLQYTLGRVPMGGTDFSTRAYTYDDNSTDHSLNSFALQPEDYKYKMPLIKQAQNLSTRGIKLYAVPWSPPAWMKTNNNVTGFGILKEGFEQKFAEYYKK